MNKPTNQINKIFNMISNKFNNKRIKLFDLYFT